MDELVLGIESSCDETSAAVVQGGRRVLSNVIWTQMDIHRQYGGVVPELASRRHLEAVLPVVDRALGEAEVGGRDLNCISVVHGPGLLGALLVGLTAAKALSLAWEVPVLGVHHIVAHVYANFLGGEEPEFPLVCLVVSGGHTEILFMPGHGRFEVLGRTRDDAAGEAFDKTARLLGLGYPGGREIDRLAQKGDPEAVPLPRTYLEEGSLDFSFSGVKTAVIHARDEAGRAYSLEDLAASFQKAVVDVLVDKTFAAAERYRVRQVLLAGGVAANSELRRRTNAEGAKRGIRVLLPPPALCTDNAAMVASAGTYLYRMGVRSSLSLNAAASLQIPACG
ncbi:MAG: tRNA (adenosine(37)-N6)-threonylcarbamoyltransferase complex transferase subunit TsaD [Bacillota bacterium]